MLFLIKKKSAGAVTKPQTGMNKEPLLRGLTLSVPEDRTESSKRSYYREFQFSQ